MTRPATRPAAAPIDVAIPFAGAFRWEALRFAAGDFAFAVSDFLEAPALTPEREAGLDAVFGFAAAFDTGVFADEALPVAFFEADLDAPDPEVPAPPDRAAAFFADEPARELTVFFAIF
jgi:hypothetical protein